MKILLVNKYHYVKGGSETYYFGLADLLTKLGHEVIYFSMADINNKPCEQEKYFVSNVDFNSNISTLQKVKAGFRVLYSFEAKKNISALIEQEHPDIVHINLVHRHITLSIVRAIKKYNIPIVFTIHDLNCICPNHEMLVNGHVCEKCLHGRYSNCIKNKCVKGSTAKSTLAAIEATNYKRMKIYDDIDLYITPSYFYKKKLEESGIIHSEIIHIKNFLPTDTVYSDNNPDNGYLLYFGRISEEKGVLTLVKAVEKLENNIPLIILGTGPIEDEIKEYIGMLYGIGENDRIFDFTKSFLHSEMRRGSKAAGVKKLTLHQLRHSHVSLLINMGFTAVAIAKRVGHESIDITYRYAHMFPSEQAEMADKLNVERSN